MLRTLKILPSKIMKMRSKIQRMNPKPINLMIAATMQPSLILVTTPQSQAVNGMIAKMIETILSKPK